MAMVFQIQLTFALLKLDYECPQTFGPIENGGCPYADTDGDSVFDKDDDCPMTPGTVANNGCPEIEEEEQEVLNTVFNNLQFQSGKAVIMESSFQSLDDLANLLIKKADFKLLIEGHTDDVGREMANMSLSQNRVMAVKNYLVSKGIDEKRFVTKWYGESNPIAPNDTEEGRAKNRRVELNVVFD
jgi:outer membrane protein OmpA-like peptidoglycan-associated protein